VCQHLRPPRHGLDFNTKNFFVAAHTFQRLTTFETSFIRYGGLR